MKSLYDRGDVEAAVILGRRFTQLTPTEVLLLHQLCLRFARKADRLAQSKAATRTSQTWADASVKLRREALRELEPFNIPSVNVQIQRASPTFSLIYP